MPWHDRRGRIPLRAIREFIDRLAARYKPLKVILFGSYARGDFNPDSDVDLLVVTQKRRRRDLRSRIRRHVHCGFPLDLIVVHEERLNRRIEENDFFLRDAVAEGRVMYEDRDQGVGQKAEEDYTAAVALSRKRKSPVPDVICCLCQQLAEKYVKAFLQEHIISFKKTHDLVALLSLASPQDPSLAAFSNQLDSLSKYGVDFRYPGRSATPGEARVAVVAARSIRTAFRMRLSLVARRRRRRP